MGLYRRMSYVYIVSFVREEIINVVDVDKK